MVVLGSTAIRLAQPSPEAFTLETASVRLRVRPRLPLEERIRADTKQKLRPFYVNLISTVHLADEEYYTGLQRECEPFDRVLFELIADESTTTCENGVRRLRAPLCATPELRQLSSGYGLVPQVRVQRAPNAMRERNSFPQAACLTARAVRNVSRPQVDMLDCMRPNWALADVPRNELLVKERDVSGGSNAGLRTALRTLSRGPASRSGGGVLGSGVLLRRLAWTLPAPELALLLDDWTNSGGAPPAQVLKGLAGATASLDLNTAKQLSFAQTLATGEATQIGSPAAELVRWRNTRAMDEVESAVEAGCEEIALLYGALHMRGTPALLEAFYVCDPSQDFVAVDARSSAPAVCSRGVAALPRHAFAAAAALRGPRSIRAPVARRVARPRATFPRTCRAALGSAADRLALGRRD